MSARRGLLVLCVAGIALGSGCASSPWTAATSSGTITATQGPVGTAQGGQPAAPGRPAGGPGTVQPVPQVDPRAVDELVAQVAAAERLDSAGREQLARDLRQTDPALWPAFVQQFRAGIAYRQQRDRAAAGGLASQPASAPTVPPKVPVVPTAAEHESRLTEAALSQKVPLRGVEAAQPRAAVEPKARDEARIEKPPAFEQLIRERAAEQATVWPEAGTFVKRALAESTPPGPPGTAGTQLGDCPDFRAAKMGLSPLGATGRVVAAGYEAPIQANWREHLAGAVTALQSEVRDAPQSAAGVELQARLRMLYLLADRREDALRPIPSAPPAVQEFWSQELYGLATWLDSQRVSDPSRRAGQSKPPLAAAVHRLEELAPLVVRNLAFITEVQSYGIYKPFGKSEFTPGQELLLYAEVENFRSEDTPKGFHTVLQGSYQIFDSRGQRVAGQELNTVEEYCRNPRRDFFLAYRLSLPKRIYAGKHTLQLSLVDQKSQKIGQASIEFSVKEGGE